MASGVRGSRASEGLALGECTGLCEANLPELLLVGRKFIGALEWEISGKRGKAYE